MKLKLVLDEIKDLSNKIHQDKGLLKFYQRQADVIPGPIYGEKIHTQPSGKAPFEKWVIKALDKEKEIKEEEDTLADLKLKATNALEKLENKDMALAIMYRHISFMKAMLESLNRIKVIRQSLINFV